MLHDALYNPSCESVQCQPQQCPPVSTPLDHCSNNTHAEGYLGKDQPIPRPSTSSTLSSATTSMIDNPSSFLNRLGQAQNSTMPRPRFEKIGPFLTISTLQAYTVLTVVRCLADPTWIVLKTSDDKTGGKENPSVDMGLIGKRERVFLGFAVAFTMLSCAGIVLRIKDLARRFQPVFLLCSILQAGCCIAAMASFLHSTALPPGAQYSHGFLACAITVAFSGVVAIMLTIDWLRGLPSTGLSATLKALIVSSFMMTTVVIIGAAIYTWLEDWTFDQSINFCIVSFTTIGYGNLSPRTTAGRIIFFILGIIGVSAIGYFIVSLRDAIIEQFEWRLNERFSKPAHLMRVHTRMSAKDLSFPMARYEEEMRVKAVVKRKMVIRMTIIWFLLWFAGAGVFCTLENWSFVESLYFCYVTLTTIGFGDLVPAEPASIEFWNVYVFVGLTIFAYVLSMSSESISSRIHLVDDATDEYDDGHVAWDQFGYPLTLTGMNHKGNSNENNPNIENLGDYYALLNRTRVVGLESLKWSQQQQVLNLQQPYSASGFQQQQNSGQQSLQSNQSSVDSHNQSIENLGQAQEPKGVDTTAQQQKGRSKRKGVMGRPLAISTKERKHMLQAEYYATHTRPTINSAKPSTTLPSPYPSSLSRTPSARYLDPYGAMSHLRFPLRRGMSIGSMSSGIPLSRRPSSHVTSPTGPAGTGHFHSAPSYVDAVHRYGPRGFILSDRSMGTTTPFIQDDIYAWPHPRSDDNCMTPITPSSRHRIPDLYLSPSWTRYEAPFGTLPYEEDGASISQQHRLHTSALQHHPQVRFLDSPKGSPRTSSTPNTQSLESPGDSLQQAQRSNSSGSNRGTRGGGILPVHHPMERALPIDHGYKEHGVQYRKQRDDRIDATSTSRAQPVSHPLTLVHLPEDECRDANTFEHYERYRESERSRQSHSSDTTKVASPPELSDLQWRGSRGVFHSVDSYFPLMSPSLILPTQQGQGQGQASEPISSRDLSDLRLEIVGKRMEGLPPDELEDGTVWGPVSDRQPIEVTSSKGPSKPFERHKDRRGSRPIPSRIVTTLPGMTMATPRPGESSRTQPPFGQSQSPQGQG